MLETISGLLGLAYYWLRKPLAKAQGTLQLPGIEAPVEIVRDQRGVPHICAANSRDLMFAQGFVHAQDRLWQMDFQRRLVAGRLSEVLGAVTVPVDRWMRILGMRRVAEKEVGLMGSGPRADVEAYVAGINSCIAEGRLPIEFTLLHYRPEPWTVADSLSWVKMMSWSLSVNWETEILRAQLIARLGPERAAELEPDYSEHWPTIVPPGADYSKVGGASLERAEAARPFTGPSARDGIGSNNWVLSGSHTTTGAPLLANDMHLLISTPAIWYENHLIGDDLNATGVTFAGIPGVVAGHNGNVAWGFTMGCADVQDLYVEHLRRTGDGRVQYEYKGEWLDAGVIREEIRVRGRETVVEEVVITRHGPVINALASEFAGEQPLALRWTSLEPDVMILALNGMNRARSCLEFREALRHWAGPVQNVVYADTAGNIAYSLAGKVPIRSKGEGRVPVPGWTGEYEWTGYIPFEELPHLYNPPQGYVATANNRVTDKYPYFISHDYAIGDRAQRIVELIKSREKIDVAYMKRMQFDQVSPTARVVAKYLGQLEVDNPRLKAIVEIMRNWDAELAPESSAAAIYEVLVRRMIHLMLSGKLDDLTVRYAGKGPTPVLSERSLFGHRALEWLQKTLTVPTSHWFDLGNGETRDDVLRLALSETADFLRVRFGAEVGNSSWGKLHKLTFAHALGRVKPLDRFFNRGPYPVGGDRTTIWNTTSYLHDLSSENIVGPPYRMIADLSNLQNSLSQLAPGQSGQPGSKHYDDQVRAWFAGEYRTMLYSREDINQETEAILHLKPAA